MTRSRPQRRWDPFRPLDMLASLWSTAAVAPMNTGASAAYKTLFVTLRRLVVGRELSVRLDEGDITLTVTEFDSRLDVRGLAVGQLSDVRLAARDIRWEDNRLDRATAVLHNVHIRPAAPPVLVASPVDLTVEFPADSLDEWFRLVAPRLAGHIGDDGVARLRLARRPGLGNLEVDADLDGSTLWLRPRGLVVGRRRLGLPNRMPGYRVQLPELPHGLTLTDISIEPDKLCLSGTLEEWRIDVPRTRLEDIVNQLSVVGRPLNLTRFGLG
ncbi:LmeA family phospholipid-binding protein [Mycolicibacterium sp. 120270]|uniref:LmeA family phospholipid-binding protein n=1 Tax=Mycolicibacterium sp. 120270 TaxID=3090600 RepID=UPI00299D48AD|nr:LmeA family phospholipid-binding protein [Mycolicibacterium sp. 120270]MDX1883620.1 LmeA family phospholipid-binding protein [Mycolicibacterium sp. 120270]